MGSPTAAASSSAPGPWRRAAGLLLHGAALALGLWLFYRRVALTGFDALPGDPGDTRFIVATLEHWWLVFHGKPDWDAMLMYFPLRHTLAYSDLLILFAPPYAALRAAGLDMFAALQGLLALLSAAGYAGMALLLRRLGCGAPVSALGALLFVVNFPLYHKVNHPQLFAVFLLPWFAWALLESLRPAPPESRRPVVAASAAALLLVGLMLTSFYVAWGAGLYTGLVALLRLARLRRSGLRWRQAWAALLAPLRRGGRWAWLPLALLGAGTAVFLWLYVPVVLQFGGRRYRDLEHTLPGLQELADVSHWNWLWGHVVGAIVPGWLTAPVPPPKGSLPPVLLLGFLAALAWWWRAARRGRAGPAFTPLGPPAAWVGYLGGAVLINWLLMLRVGGVSLWILVFNLVPGANGLREISRQQLVLFVPVLIVACLALETAWRWVRAAPGRGAALAGLALLAALLVAEQVGTGQFESLSAGEQRALLARVGTPPPQCRVFQLEPAPGASGASVFRMLDAIVVAYATRTPTWIGYTGVVLKDGYERDPTKPGYAESAARWWADHGIRQGLCALDVDSGHWRVLP